MSTTWTFAQFVDTLKTQLEALPAILAFDPVPTIRVSLPHLDESIADLICLGVDAEDDDKIQTAIGSHSHDEDVILGCLAWAVRYGSGDVEALAARDRILAYLDVVDEHLRTTPINVGLQTLRTARLENRRFISYPGLAGEDAPVRFAQVDFDITYKARTTP